jgi:hypothetical protein
MDDNIKNGSRGRAVGFTQSGLHAVINKEKKPLEPHARDVAEHGMWPEVQFDDGQRMVMGLHEFEAVCTDGTVLAQRVQVPLILAYGLTVHKAQGLTLPKVLVHVDTLFGAGSFYTALSRVREVRDVKLVCPGGVHRLRKAVRANPEVRDWLSQQRWYRMGRD